VKFEAIKFNFRSLYCY